MLFQILFTCFVFLAITQTVLTGKRVGMSVRGRTMWALLWAVALLIVWEPSTTDSLATQLGIGRGVDVILYSAITFLFFLIFKLHIKLSQIESQITKVVRDRALEEVTE